METLRLIIDDPAPGVVNMAVDETLLARAVDDPAEAAVRLYGWSEPTVSVGYAQDVSRFAPSGLPVVRRFTGGRALLHDVELTYAVVAGSESSVFTGGLAGTYNAISGCVVEALRRAGVDASLGRPGERPEDLKRDACFHSATRYEILAGGRKLVGSAQRRYKGAFLQHGSILFAVDRELNARVFGPGVAEKMASVAEFSAIAIEDFREVFVGAFSAGLGVGFIRSGLSAEEKDRRDELVATRYSTPEWSATPARSAGG